MSLTIRRLSPQEFALNADSLVDIYISAMGYDPAIREGRIFSWRREVIRPGFTALIAEDATGVIGVAYGFIGTPDSWWDRQLRLALRKKGELSAEEVEMLRSYFEVAEVHVLPRMQGHGLVRQLLTELLWNAPGKWALLSTPEVPNESNRAFSLYRSMGFTDVIRQYRYPGDERPFAILKLPLPLS